MSATSSLPPASRVLRRLIDSPWACVMVTAIAALATLSMWSRIRPVTADSVNYMAAGTNLLRHGSYTTLEGTPEVLFPPGYPDRKSVG